jgi:GNAT superfamily N-acetyltransferase
MPPYSLCKLDRLSPREEVLVAESNGVIFGAVSISHKDISYVYGDWKDEFQQFLKNLLSKISGGWISKLYVFPKYRCQGIATELVKEAVERLKENKFTEAYAGINAKSKFRKISENVFKNNGFKRVGSCICFFTQGNCRGVLLKKTIGSS